MPDSIYHCPFCQRESYHAGGRPICRYCGKPAQKIDAAEPPPPRVKIADEPDWLEFHLPPG
jgi:hypothetical protein